MPVIVLLELRFKPESATEAAEVFRRELVATRAFDGNITTEVLVDEELRVVIHVYDEGVSCQSIGDAGIARGSAHDASAANLEPIPIIGTADRGRCSASRTALSRAVHVLRSSSGGLSSEAARLSVPAPSTYRHGSKLTGESPSPLGLVNPTSASAQLPSPDPGVAWMHVGATTGEVPIMFDSTRSLAATSAAMLALSLSSAVAAADPPAWRSRPRGRRRSCLRRLRRGLPARDRER